MSDTPKYRCSLHSAKDEKGKVVFEALPKVEAENWYDWQIKDGQDEEVKAGDNEDAYLAIYWPHLERIY